MPGTPLLGFVSTAALSVLVLDASQVTFADSSALNRLLLIHQATTLRIAAPAPQLLRLLQITGADQVRASPRSRRTPARAQPPEGYAFSPTNAGADRGRPRVFAVLKGCPRVVGGQARDIVAPGVAMILWIYAVGLGQGTLVSAGAV